MKYAILITLAAALTGCPMMTTSHVDTDRTLEMLRQMTAERAQWEGELESLLQKQVVLLRPSTSGLPPTALAEVTANANRIVELTRLIDAQDNMIAQAVRGAIAGYTGGEIVITFPQPAPAMPEVQ